MITINKQKKRKRRKPFSYTVLLILIGCSVIVSGSQPPLPSSIIGKIADSNNVPVEGIAVVLLWTDESGQERTTTQTTLTTKQAQDLGDPSLAGFFLFNSGYVLANENTNVQVIVDGIYYTSLDSHPGQTVTIPTLYYLGSSQESFSQTTTTSGGTGQDGTSSESSVGSPLNLNVNGESLDTLPTPLNADISDTLSAPTVNEGTNSKNSDSQGSSDPVSDQNSQGATGTSGSSALGDLSKQKEQSSNSENDIATLDDTQIEELQKYKPEHPPDQVGSTENTPQSAPINYDIAVQPTTLFGQFLDTEGEPIIDQEIIVSWTDEQGEHEIETKTLSKKEARELDAPELEGYFLLNQGEITAPEETTLVVQSKEQTAVAYIKSSPGESSSVTLYASPTGLKPTKTSHRKDTNQTITLSFSHLLPQSNTSIMLILVLIVVILGAVYLKTKKKKVQADASPVLIRTASSFGKIKIKKLMNSPVKSISASSTVSQALSKLVDEDVNALVVLRAKKAVGIVTETSILNVTLSSRDAHQVRVEHCMSSPLKIGAPYHSLKGIIQYMITHKIRKLPILDNRELVGFVSATDLIRTIHEFFNQHHIQFDLPHLIKNIYVKNIVKVDSDDSLNMVYSKIKQQNAGCALVYETVHVSDSVPTNQAVGIITTRDLIEELNISHFRFNKTKAKQIMKSPIVTIKPGTTIFDAQRLMIERDFRRIPVLFDQKFVGVLTQLNVLEAMSEILDALVAQKKSYFIFGKRKQKRGEEHT